MVKYRSKMRGPKVKENDTSGTILIKSHTLPVKELEKITSLLLETLSTTFDGKTIEIEGKELRVSSSISNGTYHSISISFSY
jgi:hypothetical protein